MTTTPPRIDVTEADLLTALANARPERAPRPPGFYTIAELAEKSGENVRRVRERMAVLRAQDRVLSQKVYVTASDGRRMEVTAYKLKAAP